jgi:hypothetical protein
MVVLQQASPARVNHQHTHVLAVDVALICAHQSLCRKRPEKKHISATNSGSRKKCPMVFFWSFTAEGVTSPMAQSHRGGHSRLYNPSEPKLHFAKIAIIYQNLRGFPPSPCCGSVRGRHPLKTVLKPHWKPTGKSVGL